MSSVIADMIKKMKKFATIHSGKWIFIRFNPDNTKDQKTDIEDRISVLLDVMEEQMERVIREENHELVEIIKLFY